MGRVIDETEYGQVVGRKKEVNDKKSGLSVWGVVQIIFLILKLTKLVDWSWKWVLAPSWIWLILVVICCIYLWNKY